MEFNLNFAEIVKNDIKHTLYEVLRKKLYTKVIDLKIKGAVTKEPVSYLEKDELTYREFKIGESWPKELFDCGWFNLTGKIKDYDPTKVYTLRLDISGEALLYDNQGIPLKGFTNKNSDFDPNLGYPGKEYYDISRLINEDGKINLWVEAGANDLFGNLKDEGKILNASVGFLDEEKVSLFYDLEVLVDLFCSLKDDAENYYLITQKLYDISSLIKYDEKDWLKKTKVLTQELLGLKSNSNLEVTALGHAHLDLAWLWPIRESKRKIVRTLTNVFYLIEKYPEFKFGISQPQQIDWVKKNEPEVFKTLKKYIKEGRIIPQGGMWVEADTNVSGEEALVRQMLYGIRYFQKEFNVRVNELWLPDVFGYNGNLPQIISKSGLDHFVTIKISWSLINKFPYKSFTWQAVDGSKVLVHMPPEGSYNSACLPRSLKDAERKHSEKEISNNMMVLYGIGDGGGGPGREHVERILREKDLTNLPKVSFGDQNEFFSKLEKDQAKLPSYQGELYLENHQGTYTSAPEVKRYNRLLEETLRSLENYLTLTNNYQKHQKELEKIWKEVLLYQFHDILPGSSIKRVYDECLKRYPILLEKLNEMESGKLEFNPNLTDSIKITKEDDKYLVTTFKPLSTICKKEYFPRTKEKVGVEVKTKNLLLTIDKKTGGFSSIKLLSSNKELLKSKANFLAVYKDFGDGWNISWDYRKQTPEALNLLSQKIYSYGRFVEIINDYGFLNSKVLERVLIDKETDLIYFYHDVDIKDLGIMLRTAFGFDIAPEKAYFDIQFGELSRSSRNKTSIEKAQFEVPGQKWLAYQEKGILYGLLNKAKYGFYAKDGVLDINLVRTTNYPGKSLGIGKNSYSYVLVLKEGFETSDLDLLANQYNTEYPKVNEEVSSKLNFLKGIKDLEVSAIKNQEDGDGIIVRLYNRTNKEVKLSLDSQKYDFYETNLVEENPRPITNQELNFGKFEVKTLLINQKH